MIRRIFERVIWVGVVAIVAIVIAGAITYRTLDATMQAEESSQVTGRLVATSKPTAPRSFPR